jgi:hypothetical protein
MTYHRFAGSTVLSLAVTFIALAPAAWSQIVRDRADAPRILTVENVRFNDGEVSGEVVNHSPNTVRDVQLFISDTWLWNNEFKPGKNDPGASTYYTLPKEIPPSGRVPFTFKPSSPLPKRSGGRFDRSVAVAGYTEIIPQKR